MRYPEAVDKFLQECGFAGKSRKTLSTYSYVLGLYGRWLEETGTDYLAVNGKETKEFRNYLAAKGLKPKSINLAVSTLSSFYAFLVDEGVLRGNPISGKKLRVKETQDLPRYLSEEEIARIRAFLQDCVPDYVRLGFEVMLFAGLRISEVVRLTKEDVVLMQGRVFLRVRGKGGKERLAPLVDAEVAREVLRRAGEVPEGEPLFASYANLEWWARAVRLATGVRWSPHSLRHSFATRLLAEGHGLDVIQEALGHASIQTTRKYARTLPERLFRLAAAASC